MSFRQALAPRSIHVRIVPRPANLSESREIYRVLQKFGEINTYKSLRYEYQSPAENSAFAIYRDQKSAQRALDASPLYFNLERVVPSTTNPNQPRPAEDEEEGGAESHDQFDSLTQQDSPDQGMDMMLRPSQLTNPSLRSAPTTKPTPQPTPMPFESTAAPQTQNKQTKWFQVTLDRSRAVHQDYIERQPFWKQFNPMKSMAQEDLVKTVPHPGLSDVSKRPPNAHRTPARVLRIMNDYVENERQLRMDAQAEDCSREYTHYHRQHFTFLLARSAFEEWQTLTFQENDRLVQSHRHKLWDHASIDFVSIFSKMAAMIAQRSKSYNNSNDDSMWNIQDLDRAQYSNQWL